MARYFKILSLKFVFSPEVEKNCDVLFVQKLFEVLG